MHFRTTHNANPLNFKKENRLRSLLLTLPLAFCLAQPALVSAEEKSLLEIFDEEIAQGSRWTSDTAQKNIRADGGYDSPRWLYLRSSNSPVSLTGISIPIRENPGPGEYRFLSFTWRLWGHGRIAIQLDRDPSKDGENKQGAKYGYRFDAGTGDAVEGKALRVTKTLSNSWQTTASDLWKDFGDFTITGITFYSESRDVGFDGVYLAKTQKDFRTEIPLFLTQVAPSTDVENTEPDATEAEADTEEDEEEVEVNVDWVAQIMAGGWMMIPLFLIGLAMIIIAVQRLLTVRQNRLAPEPLRDSIVELVEQGDLDGAWRLCDQHPSTLASAMKFILEHSHAGMDIVSQAAGDIAARDIRGHLARIYPLSVIASLSPILGLLGTIIGMIEAFALVALYGDEGGASILSNSISKALITTAAGLIIAAPAIALYFVLKNRIMRLSTLIEIEIESLITTLYLKQSQDGSPQEPHS